MHKLKIGKYTRSMREAPLTLASLAAMAPNDLQLDFVLVDASIDPIPWDMKPDIVGISVMTGTANGAYYIADHFRHKGAPIVLGGVHATIMPEEAAGYADSIVIGMAENTWPRLLRDFVSDDLKPRYEDFGINANEWINGLPSPRMDLIRRSGYMVPDSVQATRGCSKNCDFCSVPTVWKRFQKRPIADVIRDAKKLKGKYLAFGDVNLIDDPEYAKELFSGLIPLKKSWGGLATTEVYKDPELINLMAKSGCKFLLIGFESINQPSLNGIAKGFNNRDEYSELISTLHTAGISVQGCFVFGFDHDDKSVFQATVQRVKELKIDIPRFSIYTPYPGTRLFNRLVLEDRITSYNWDDYDTMHVVFEPQQMSSKELFNGFKWAYKSTFKMGHILKRLPLFSRSFPINLAGNITYKMFAHRLYKDIRFALPCSNNSPVTFNTTALKENLSCRI